MDMFHTDIGQCIYCGNTKPPLTREHVLPRGLGGFKSPNGYRSALVLQNASCEPCRKATQQIENDCLVNMLPHIRGRLGWWRKDRSARGILTEVRLPNGSTE